MKWWEDICSRCGLCCHEKVIMPEFLVVDTAAACGFFDKDTGLCSVYEDRFRACKRCMKVSLPLAMFSAALPETCAYASWARRHHIRFARKRELILEENIL